MALELLPLTTYDLPLIRSILSNFAMMKDLGGIQNDQQIIAAHKRYLEPERQMFKIITENPNQPAGTVGIWSKEYNGQTTSEMGWMILPEYQGKGLAKMAANLVLEMVKRERKYSTVCAFPAISNIKSNSLCEQLGFSKISECTIEYPRGNFLKCNHWELKI